MNKINVYKGRLYSTKKVVAPFQINGQKEVGHMICNSQRIDR